MKHIDFILYFVVIVLTILVVSVFCLIPKSTFSTLQEKNKYFNDKYKNNYVNFSNSLSANFDLTKVTEIRMNDFRIEFNWENHPSNYHVMLFNDPLTIPLEKRNVENKKIGFISPGVKAVNLEFFASNVYSYPIIVTFIQYDDNEIIGLEKKSIKLPFSLAQYYHGNEYKKLYSLIYNVDNNSKYYQIDIKIYSYFDNDHFYLSYLDMNWCY